MGKVYFAGFWNDRLEFWEKNLDRPVLLFLEFLMLKVVLEKTGGNVSIFKLLLLIQYFSTLLAFIFCVHFVTFYMWESMEFINNKAILLDIR